MAYSWIARTYGLKFSPGQRVRFTEERGGPQTGTVAKPGHGKDPHHVRVLFDGERKPSRCHPLSLVVLRDEVGR